VNPAYLLAALFVLIGAQATRLIAPRRLGYLAVLGLAAAGLTCAELAAGAIHGFGPQAGALHPVADVCGMAVFELVGALLAPRPAA